MRKNMGKLDRTLRTVVALGLLAVVFTGSVAGWLQFLLGLVAAVFLITSAVGSCPLYRPFGIDTHGSRRRPTGT